MFKFTLLGLSLTLGMSIATSASAAIHIEQPTRTSASTRLQAQSLTPLKSSQPLEKKVIRTAKPGSALKIPKNGQFVPIQFDRTETDARFKAAESARLNWVQEFHDNSNSRGSQPLMF
jgi:hypothetical protein